MDKLERPVPGVIVPLDGSAHARRALDPAVRAAQALGCFIELVTIYDQVRGRWARDLDDIADSLPFDDVEVAVVGSGWPGEVLAEMAREKPGTLICMATQDQDHLQRLALGSVSTYLMRVLDEPVLFVGPGCSPTPGRADFDELVVCVDDSARAAAAVRVAAVWAARLGIDVTLVHITAESGRRRPMEATLDTYVAQLVAEGTSATALVLVSDEPADTLSDLLRSRRGAVALTVSQGRGNLTRLLLGSFTSQLLARSPVPVLVA